MYKTAIILWAFMWLTAATCGEPKAKLTASNKPKNNTAATQDTGNDVSKTSQVPKQRGWVNDFVMLFSKEEKSYLDSLLSNYEKETSNEIAIVTIPDSWTTPEKFDSLIVAIHNQWGVGKKDKNNGILIGISPTLRKIRISNGYGIEAILTDDETKKIIESIIIPEYKQEHFFEGTKKGILAIQSKLH